MPGKKKSRPATSPQARENQMIALAVDLAEKRIRDGSVSSQVLTHYLKLGTVEHELDRKLKEAKKELMDAKADAIKSVKRSEELFEKAIKAMAEYSGQGGPTDEEA